MAVTLDEAKLDSLMQIKLNRLKSGDTDNGVYINAFSDDEKRKKMIQKLATLTSPFDALSQTIFTATDIDDDVVRRATTWLTFNDIIEEMHGDKLEVPPKQLYFALIVNWNASRGKGQGISKITSYDSLNAAKQATKGDLDYRDYIINGPGEDTKFKGDYKSIKLSPKGFSCGMTLELPIIKGLLGATYKFASGEKVPGRISFDCDSNGTDYIIPANVWLRMIAEGVNARKSPRFSKLDDFGKLSKIVSENPKDFVSIFGINGFTKGAAIMNVYQNEIDDNGILFLLNVRVSEDEYPELKDSSLSWEQNSYGSSKIRLDTRKEFYIVNTTSNTLDVYLP